MGKLSNTVKVQGKTDWNYFTDEEKKNTESVVRLVSLLYNMCKLQIVKKAYAQQDLDSVQTLAVQEKMKPADTSLNEL
jgi:hypothetical protein